MEWAKHSMTKFNRFCFKGEKKRELQLFSGTNYNFLFSINLSKHKCNKCNTLKHPIQLVCWFDFDVQIFGIQCCSTKTSSTLAKRFLWNKSKKARRRSAYKTRWGDAKNPFFAHKPILDNISLFAEPTSASL